MNPEEVQDSPKDKLKEQQEQLLRLRADFENTKKRLERDKLDAIKFANEKLLIEILPIMDNLDRAMASIAQGHDLEMIKKGLLIAQSELHKVLEQNGVEVVKSQGLEFDPKLHEAVGTVNDPKMKEGVVGNEIQRGYKLNGRLIRPSLVQVVQREEKEKQN